MTDERATSSVADMVRGRRGVMAGALALMAVIVVVAVMVALGRPSQADSADGSASHDHSDHNHGALHAVDRFTDPGVQWPPEPENITDERPLSIIPGELGPAAGTTGSSALAIAEADPRVQAALGADHSYLGTTDNGTKGAPATSETVQFFSRSANATVDVTIAAGEVAEISVRPAVDYQPPLAPDEVDLAISVAGAYWADADDPRVADLDGFAIRAFDRDGSFFDARMAYVTFHEGVAGYPELLAWVDLTNGVVVESEVVR